MSTFPPAGLSFSCRAAEPVTLPEAGTAFSTSRMPMLKLPLSCSMAAR